jgi:hypothetical protein
MIDKNISGENLKGAKARTEVAPSKKGIRYLRRIT